MNLPRIAITMGDPAGVGPELCLRLLADPQLCGEYQPVVFGDVQILERVASACGPSWRSEWMRRLGARELAADLAPAATGEVPWVVDLPAADLHALRPGVVNAATGRAAFAYIDAAIGAALSGHVDAVVTGPVHKRAINDAGISFPGHTEVFAERTGCHRWCMMLTSEHITCSLVTAHVGYHEVMGLLSTPRILEVMELSHAALWRLRGRAPRLVVCGLNPHAGESGLFGRQEEERLIAPAVELARQRGIDVTGPLPADTAFVERRRRETDGYICMYHDQGLIPLKALAFDTGVNVTLGLPIIRTSVDHGTALDIAWQGLADASSLIAATKLALQLVRSQAFGGASGSGLNLRKTEP